MRTLLQPHERGPRGLEREQPVGRRTFVGLLAAAGAAGIGIARGSGHSAFAAAPARAATPPDGLVLLGRAYLHDHPSESNADRLVRKLPGVDARRKVRPQLGTLAAAIADDFHAGRVVTVQGWQLALTEARAAAAVALGR
jgi:hypothetical protein